MYGVYLFNMWLDELTLAKAYIIIQDRVLIRILYGIKFLPKKANAIIWQPKKEWVESY